MDFGFGERIAVVTGASRGIGRAVAMAFAEEGVHLVLCARGAEALHATAADIEALGATCATVVADVATEEGCRAVIDTATRRFGHVDILVNNAGSGGSPTPLLDISDDVWRSSWELNLMSAVRLSRAVVPEMRERGWGRLVHVASRVGREPDPYFAAYGAAKAALINFSKSLANAFSRDGVLSNCVVPGLVRTENVAQAALDAATASGKSIEEVWEATMRKRPIAIGRPGEPEEVAGLVVFLASEQARWISGGCFNADGGGVRSAM